MVQGIQSYIDMLRKFGSEVGLPKLDVDKLIEAQRKNIDALERSAKAAAGGAQSVAQKQREVLEAGLREASTLARGFQPLGNLQENLARQSEFVKKVFEIAVKGAQDSAQVSRQSTSDAVTIIRDRLKEGFDELRASVSRTGSGHAGDKPKT
jgi:phasin family protein